MPKVIPPVLSALDLPPEELIASRLDGELFSIGECFAPVDQADDALHRALAVADIAGTRFVAERSTAAWIHGGSDSPPPRHELCVDIGARYRMVGASRAVVREVVLTASDIVSFSSVRVTTPRRTAMDLTRREGVLQSGDADAIRRLSDVHGFSLEWLLDDVQSRYRLPGKLASMQKIRQLMEE